MAFDYGRMMARKRALEKKNKLLDAAESAPKAQRVKKSPKESIPTLFTYPMDSYEGGAKQGLDWALNEELATELVKRVDEENLTILQMPTGTGKTSNSASALARMQLQLGSELKFIVVMSRKIMDGGGWQATLKAWNDAHPENVLRPYMLETYDRFSNILDNPFSCREVVKALGKDAVIVIDEIQNYASVTSKRSKKLLRVKHLPKLGVSATPFTSSVLMSSVSYLVMSGRYTSKTNFFDKSGLNGYLDFYGNPQIYTDDNRIDGDLWPYYETMTEEMSHIIYAPDFEFIGMDMPGVRSRVVQLARSDDLDAKMRSLHKAYSQKAFDSAGDLALAMMETINTDEARLNKLVELVRAEGVVQPIVFYWHKVTLAAIEERLKREGIDYGVISGSHSIEDVDLNSDNPILIQYQAGAEGIELKHSNTTIFYQNQASHYKRTQAQGRNVRRGMTHEVSHYMIVADNSFDQEIFERVMNGEELSNNTLADIAQRSIDTN